MNELLTNLFPCNRATPLRMRMPSEDARVACVPVLRSFRSALNRNHNHYFGHAASGR